LILTLVWNRGFRDSIVVSDGESLLKKDHVHTTIASHMVKVSDE